MLNVYPDYYPLFRCAADRCAHTCCAGWEIDIDQETLEKYRRLAGPLAQRMDSALSLTPEPHFLLGPGERCPFLNGKNLCDLILEAGEEGFQAMSTVYAADDFETLGKRAGLSGEALQNFVKSIERYNELCALGRDEDFGKDADLMNAFDEPPYFVETVEDFHMGSMMVTVGGLLTNEYQNVLDQNRDPIPGLYATGNCCGRRFGTQYSTPISGVSVGIAITLGKLCGENAAKGL